MIPKLAPRPGPSRSWSTSVLGDDQHHHDEQLQQQQQPLPSSSLTQIHEEEDLSSFPLPTKPPSRCSSLPHDLNHHHQDEDDSIHQHHPIDHGSPLSPSSYTRRRNTNSSPDGSSCNGSSSVIKRSLSLSSILPSSSSSPTAAAADPEHQLGSLDSRSSNIHEWRPPSFALKRKKASSSCLSPKKQPEPRDQERQRSNESQSWSASSLRPSSFAKSLSPKRAEGSTHPPAAAAARKVFADVPLCKNNELLTTTTTPVSSPHRGMNDRGESSSIHEIATSACQRLQGGVSSSSEMRMNARTSTTSSAVEASPGMSSSLVNATTTGGDGRVLRPPPVPQRQYRSPKPTLSDFTSTGGCFPSNLLLQSPKHTPLHSSSSGRSAAMNLMMGSTLTPPVSSSQPWIVSAKRLGKDVRRKHTKRRRCRSLLHQNDENMEEEEDEDEQDQQEENQKHDQMMDGVASRSWTGRSSSFPLLNVNDRPNSCRPRTRRRRSRTRGFCLWKEDDEDDCSDEGKEQSSCSSRPGSHYVGGQQEYRSEDDDDEEEAMARKEAEELRRGLPCLFAPNREQTTPQERNQQFWNFCYGSSDSSSRLPPLAPSSLQTEATSAKVTAATTNSNVARAPAPLKGCLSHPRPTCRRNTSLPSAFRTPPTTPDNDEAGDNQTTATNSSTGSTTTASKNKKAKRTSNRVKFGAPQAAEFDADGLIGQLTPMPSDVTRQRFSMDEKQPTEVEEELTQATKNNSAVLDAWEGSFDEPRSASRRKRKNHSRSRRSSALFTPSPLVGLLRDDDDKEQNDSNQDDVDLPLSVIEANASSRLHVSQSSPETPHQIQAESSLRQSSSHTADTAVLAHLASLRMASPTPMDVSDPRKKDVVAVGQLTPPDYDHNIEERTKTTPAAEVSFDHSTPDENFLQKDTVDSNFLSDQKSTAEFRVSLSSVNTSGAAMDISPTKPIKERKTLFPDETPVAATISRVCFAHALETTPPPSSITMDGIHSVGAASLSSVEVTNDQRKACDVGFHGLSAAREDLNAANLVDSEQFCFPTNVTEALLDNPDNDQEWDFITVVRNLLRLNIPKKPAMDELIDSLPVNDGVFKSCLEELEQRARYCANTKSSTKFKVAAKDSLVARQIAVGEWRLLESELLDDYQSALRRNSDRDEKTLQTLLSKQRQNSAEVEQTLTTKFHGKESIRYQNALEEDISSLQVQIESLRGSAETENALTAPMAALRCQLSSHLGISGFRLEQYTGHSIQLMYEHVVEGSNSQVTFLLDDNRVSVKPYFDNDRKSVDRAISLTSKVSLFHEFGLKRIERCVSTMDPTELSENMHILARHFGFLDQAALDLSHAMKLNDHLTFCFKLPLLEIISRKGTQVTVSFEESPVDALGDLRVFFAPKSVTLYQNDGSLPSQWEGQWTGDSRAYFTQVMDLLGSST